MNTATTREMNKQQGSEIVLVVDDSADTLSLINDTLEEAGYDVLVALEGKQALAIANRLRPDLVLLDALMPQMDGFETCRALKRDPALSAVPVIFMTGLSDSGSVVRGLEAGGVDYLNKPVRPDELLARMKVHLSNARLTSQAWRALDSIGHFLLSANARGEMVWATPETYALLARVALNTPEQRSAMARQLTTWLARAPARDQRLSFQGLASPLGAVFVEALPGGESLLRLVEQGGAAGEEALRQGLGLTPRESQVLLWLSKGKANREIAEILGMSPRTVNKHLEQVFPKLGVENRTAAARTALQVLGDDPS